MRDQLARLEARAERVGECLLLPNKSYVRMRYNGGAQESAHRASFLIHNGPLAAGQLVRHSCDEPRCIEPSHLLAGTPGDNARDMAERRRGCIGLRSHAASVPPDVVNAAIDEYLRGGVSQAAMAERLGVSQATFSRWLRGERRRDVEREPVLLGKGRWIGRNLRSAS